jgi:GT2 family glycosyltransferase
MPGAETLPLSVVVPTIGRVSLLRGCLESLTATRPSPAELVVVDQSGGSEVAAVVEELASVPLRHLVTDTRGVAAAMNDGIAAASNETVAVTHDDCTVAPDWVENAHYLASAQPDALLTGRVLPVGDPLEVPSTNQDPTRRDFSGTRRSDVLYPNNMVVPRRGFQEIGGFDPRFREAAEDNDLCYRWLGSGRNLFHEPDLVVHHHDWRSRADLARLYVRYWRAQGVFYGKHLRGGDLTMLRFLLRDLRAAARAWAASRVRGRPRWSDARRGVLAGIPPGLLVGLRGGVG